MEDLFKLGNEEKEIRNNDNGRVISKKTPISKVIRKNKRDLSCKAILDEQGGLPKTNECLLIKSNGTSDTGGFLTYMLNEGEIDELIISRSNINFICENIDNGKIKKLIFIVSYRMKQMTGGSGRATYNFLIEEFKKRDQIKIRVPNSHAKTFSAKIGKKYYTVTGSGNWTENPRIENYIITNDKNIYDFNKEWMSDLL